MTRASIRDSSPLRIKRMLACVGLLLGLIACQPGPDRLAPLQIEVDSQGVFHLAGRYRTGEGEGGGYGYKQFLYGWGKAGDWQRDSIDLGIGDIGSSFESIYRLAIENGDRPILVADLAEGLRVRTKALGSWIAMYPFVGLDELATQSLNTRNQLNAAWTGSDGIVRILSGNWLFEIDEGTIARATDTGRDCLLQGRGDPMEDCFFDPTGDRQGQAAVYYYTGHPLQDGLVHLLDLSCDATDCQWSEVPDVDLGTTDPGGSSGPHHRLFFHTADGTPVLVRRVGSASGENYALQANWPDGELVLAEEDVYKVGAAARKSGGFVAVAETYSNTLHLFVVDQDFSSREIFLATLSYRFMRSPLAVLPIGEGESEHVHVFVSMGSRSVTHLDVNLTTDSIQMETIEL
jgi:hypothetical protein